MTTDEQRVTQLCDELLAKLDPKTTPAAEFLGAQYDLGLGWVHYPEGVGGLGLSPKLQNTINSKLFAAGAPIPYARNPIGTGMCAPTIVTHGSDAQKQRYLRPLFAGEEIWCQMFSEPGAGSDVAGLSTRAIRDGDEWVLNGQKVWTTLAHVAAFGIVLARTDPEQVKHKGLTMFVIDMHAPGVEVRPLVQATGDAEFNEVYMTDVRIPDSERLGDIGEGWGVSLTTLMNERVSIGGQVNPRGSGVIAVAVNAWKQNVQRQDAVARDALLKLWTDAEVNRLTNIARQSVAAQGNARSGRFGRQARDGRAQPAHHEFRDGSHGPRRDALPERVHVRAPPQCNGSVECAEGIPARPGQFHRGWHHEHHEEHPRRAGARAAGRAPARQGSALEPSSPKLTKSPNGRLRGRVREGFVPPS